jgi:glutathione S-transferase
MIVAHPRSRLPAKLRGLHLFHYGIAACAQRVRFVLAEKGFRRGPGVPWRSDAEETLAPPDHRTYVSRPVSLARKEHLTAEYAAIHPNMVLPALVHDGVVHIESIDIIEHIDRVWPDPPLLPRDPALAAECKELLTLGAELHPSLRWISNRWNFGRLGRTSPAQEALLLKLEPDTSPERLGAFYSSYNRNLFGEAVYVSHLRRVEDGFEGLERRLARSGAWLLGRDFTLADIVWSCKMQRVVDCGYPFARAYPSVCDWFKRVTARPTFREAVWRDIRRASTLFRAQSAFFNFLGVGIASVARGLTSDRATQP